MIDTHVDWRNKFLAEPQLEVYERAIELVRLDTTRFSCCAIYNAIKEMAKRDLGSEPWLVTHQLDAVYNGQFKEMWCAGASCDDIILKSVVTHVVDRACALIESGEMQFSCTALKLATVLSGEPGSPLNITVGCILVDLYAKSAGISVGRNILMPNWWGDNTLSEENKQARIAALKHFKSLFQ